MRRLASVLRGCDNFGARACGAVLHQHVNIPYLSSWHKACCCKRYIACVPLMQVVRSPSVGRGSNACRSSCQDVRDASCIPANKAAAYTREKAEDLVRAAEVESYKYPGIDHAVSQRAAGHLRSIVTSEGLQETADECI